MLTEPHPYGRLQAGFYHLAQFLYLHIHIFVQFGSKMARHLPAAVVVSVVFRDVVHVVEDHAVPVQVLYSLQEANVEEHGSVERLAPTLNDAFSINPKLRITRMTSSFAFTQLYLLNDIEGKLQSLPLQHGKEVLEEDGEVFMTVPERDQDGHLQRMGVEERITIASSAVQQPFLGAHLPVRYAVLGFPMTSKFDVKEFGKLEFRLLHGNLCHVHIYKALCGGRQTHMLGVTVQCSSGFDVEQKAKIKFLQFRLFAWTFSMKGMQKSLNPSERTLINELSGLTRSSEAYSSQSHCKCSCYTNQPGAGLVPFHKYADCSRF